MLTPATMETLRTIAEGIGFVALIVMARLKKAERKRPLSIAAEEEPEEGGDRRGPVRRSELMQLIRKVEDLVGKVDDLIDLVADHQNRLDEGDGQRAAMLKGLKDLTDTINFLRSEISAIGGHP